MTPSVTRKTFNSFSSDFFFLFPPFLDSSAGSFRFPTTPVAARRGDLSLKKVNAFSDDLLTPCFRTVSGTFLRGIPWMTVISLVHF